MLLLRVQPDRSNAPKALAGPNDFGIVSHTIAIDALRNEGGWAMALVLLEMAECRGPLRGVLGGGGGLC